MIAWVQAALAAEITLTDASDRLDGVRIVSMPVGGVGYSGVALLDVDADGDLDLYFGNGPGRPNALLQNDGTGRFTDVAVEAGAAVGTGTGGVLAADLDGDGYPDLVLPGDKSNLVTLGNLGDGTFADVTVASRLVGARRNISAHAADIDLDGDLDVYVGASRVPETAYLNTLWRNNGDRTFTEIGEAAGVATRAGHCAATFTHLDDDTAIDLLIANCNDNDLLPRPYEVYRNLGDGTFVDIQSSSRIWAVGHFMAVAMGDFDGDLRLDFFSTNIGTVGDGRDGPHALYRANGDGTWSEVAAEVGVAEHVFGWGAASADLDNDGWEDLYYVGKAHAPDGVASPGLLFRNRGGTFDPPVIPVDLSDRYTVAVAAGDVDGNGWMDLVVVVTDSPDGSVPGHPVLLLNEGTGAHWLEMRLQGTWDNRAGIGATVFVTAAGRSQLREVAAGTGYKSTSSPWPHFGLGDATSAEVCVRWPDGTEEGFGTVAADQRLDLVQGQGAGAACPVPGGEAAPTAEEEERGCGGCAAGAGGVGWGLGLAGCLAGLLSRATRRAPRTARRRLPPRRPAGGR
jgi:enediyne biosynthesis protein E4